MGLQEQIVEAVNRALVEIEGDVRFALSSLETAFSNVLVDLDFKTRDAKAELLAKVKDLLEKAKAERIARAKAKRATMTEHPPQAEDTGDEHGREAVAGGQDFPEVGPAAGSEVGDDDGDDGLPDAPRKRTRARPRSGGARRRAR